MSLPSTFIYLLRILLLTIILTIVNIIGGIGSGLASLDASPSPDEAGNAFLILLGVNLMNAFLVSILLVRSPWRGWKLVLAVGSIYFGISTFMPQLETWFFGEAMGINHTLLAQFILSGAITTVFFAPIAVLLFRKMKGKSESVTSPSRQITGLVWKLPALTLLYILLYFVFGYYIAWQSPMVRLYYTHSTELLPFIQHIGNLLKSDTDLFFFQMFRGVLWVGFVLLILQCCKGKNWELALFTGLLLGLLLTVPLFLPNPFMPREVRMIHFVETSFSTFLFGVIAALLLTSQKEPRSTSLV